MTDLTAITAPFGLLDEVYGPGTQEALKAHGGPWEMYAHEGWERHRDPLWVNGCTYRVRPTPLTPDSIDWSHVAPQFKWMARDGNGAVWLYAEEPSLNPDTWVTGADFERATTFASYRRGTVDWHDSLVRRPE